MFDLLRLDPDLPVLVVEHPLSHAGHDPLLPTLGLQVFRLLLILKAGVIGFLDYRLLELYMVYPTDSLGET